ncbi:hypothetical protein PRIPAC_74482, partial [Pristionchus pacificus]
DYSRGVQRFINFHKPLRLKINMCVAQLHRMDEIEAWRQKAFVLSRTDRLGRLITKTFDLILTVVRDGPNAEILTFDVESLKAEQSNDMKFDQDRDDIFRSLFYGMSASIGLMIESIKERKEDSSGDAVVPSEDDTQQSTNAYNNETYNIQSPIQKHYVIVQDHHGFLSETAKLEPAEFQEDFSLCDLDDLKLEPLTDRAENAVEVSEAVTIEKGSIIARSDTQEEASIDNERELSKLTRSRLSTV